MREVQTYNVKIYGPGITYPVDEFLELPEWLVELAIAEGAVVTAGQQGARAALTEHFNGQYPGISADPTLGFTWDKITLILPLRGGL